MQFDLNSSDYYRNFAANITETSGNNAANSIRTDSGNYIEMEEGSVVESHADSRKRILESKISQEENPQRLRELQKMAADLATKRNNEISRQEQLIRKQLNVEEDFRDSEDRVFQNRNYEGVSYDETVSASTNYQTTTRTVRKVTNHPMYEVFKGVKKTQELDLNIVWKEMLPRWDFMQMMEESHEVSIIEYFTNLILENILEDSETLKAMINKALMIKIYGEEEYNKMLKEEETRLKKAEEERMIKEIEEKLKQEKKETLEKVLREQMEKEESLEVEESDIKLDLDIKIDEEEDVK